MERRTLARSQEAYDRFAKAVDANPLWRSA
jgi:hypothetical protein